MTSRNRLPRLRPQTIPNCFFSITVSWNWSHIFDQVFDHLLGAFLASSSKLSRTDHYSDLAISTIITGFTQRQSQWETWVVGSTLRNGCWQANNWNRSISYQTLAVMRHCAWIHTQVWKILGRWGAAGNWTDNNVMLQTTATLHDCVSWISSQCVGTDWRVSLHHA